MESESLLFSGAVDAVFSQSPSEVKLLKAGPRFSYYRISHDGKYFFFKAASINFPEAEAILRREYELAAGCDNPYIADVYMYGEFIEGKKGILIEYVEGATLSDFLSANPSLAERRRIFGELLDAVSYLHTKGLIHNDLKPDNVLITSAGSTVKLIDFGLSDDSAHYLLKTPGCTDSYAAPELRRDRKSDARSDVYSLGLIMRLLFGSRYGHISKKCLADRPCRRYQNLNILSRAWSRRNRPYIMLLSIVAAIVVVVGVGMATFALKERNRRFSEVETALLVQKDKNRQQGEELRELQGTLAQTNAEYQSMKDSIDKSNHETAAHEKLKTERLAAFGRGLVKRRNLTYDSLQRCKTWREMNHIIQNYNAAVADYYTAFPKDIDGEDITAEISGRLASHEKETEKHFDILIKEILH